MMVVIVVRPNFGQNHKSAKMAICHDPYHNKIAILLIQGAQAFWERLAVTAALPLIQMV